MQQLTLTQLQAISGGTVGSTIASLSNLVYATSGAFQNSLTPSELGVALVGFSMGAGIASMKAGMYQTAGLAVLGGYAVYSHYKPDFSGLTNWFNTMTGSAPAADATTV